MYLFLQQMATINVWDVVDRFDTLVLAIISVFIAIWTSRTARKQVQLSNDNALEVVRLADEANRMSVLDRDIWQNKVDLYIKLHNLGNRLPTTMNEDWFNKKSVLDLLNLCTDVMFWAPNNVKDQLKEVMGFLLNPNAERDCIEDKKKYLENFADLNHRLHKAMRIDIGVEVM